MTTPLEVAEKDIVEKLDSLEYTIMAGKCTSFEQYKHCVGQYRGLKVAQHIYNTRLMEDPDDE